MKKFFNTFKARNTRAIAQTLVHRLTCNAGTLFYLAIFLSLFLFAGCQKQAVNETKSQVQLPGGMEMQASATNNNGKSADAEFLNMYSGLSWQTSWELQQARAATARYRNINNAIKDGYSDIMVDVPNMGHHFMNTGLVDGTFDIRKPEILVYNKDEDGIQQLVAVEYA
ncbi:MAG TPA: hypothetical protein VJ111_13450, partial [Chitinophagaceae bacterium]|nr:hypothetical protein [Chitinophagaceae bacterium]